LTKFKQENNASNKLGKVGEEVAAAEPVENIRIAFLNRSAIIFLTADLN
jgi:hypothetical protein